MDRCSAKGLDNITDADVAQLVEQSIRNRQVTGSIPVVGSRDFKDALFGARFAFRRRVSRPMCKLHVFNNFRTVVSNLRLQINP